MTDLTEIEAALEAHARKRWVLIEDSLDANAPAWLAELVERVKVAEWATTVLQCSVSHEDPYDFDYCETHDRTFPIGGKCDHAGISELDYWVDQASMQRGRAVGAEMRVETAEATIARVRELAEEHPGTAWNSGLNLRQALRDALGGTPTDAPEGADSADDERNRFSGEDVDGMRSAQWDRPEVALIRHMGGRVYARVGAHKWTELPKFGQVIVTEDLVAQQHEEIAVFTAPLTSQRYEPPADDHESGCCR